MNKKRASLVLVLIGMFILSASAIMAVSVVGTLTATGTAGKNSPNHSRVGKHGGGKVTINSVTVKDKFGHPKTITWRIVGGAGTSRPTVKISPALDNGDYVSIDLTTARPGSFGYADLHIY